jgi:hypothetical protein
MDVCTFHARESAGIVPSLTLRCPAIGSAWRRLQRPPEWLGRLLGSELNTEGLASFGQFGSSGCRCVECSPSPRGSLKRIISVDPLPPGGSRTMMSPSLTAALMTAQHTGIRWLPRDGYPPTARCKSPASTSTYTRPLRAASPRIRCSCDSKSCRVGGIAARPLLKLRVNPQAAEATETDQQEPGNDWTRSRRAQGREQGGQVRRYDRKLPR